MSVYSTEITSDQISSDNPLHQRLLKAYLVSKSMVRGAVLEVGCGEGRGIEVLASVSETYTAVDKIKSVLEELSSSYPEIKFVQANIPPFTDFSDSQFDTVVGFQVIEHIRKDDLFLKEIHRILKPGGKALISTPNIRQTLSRNPWHIREYTASQLTELAKRYFEEVQVRGIAGDDKVMAYHQRNRESVNRIMRWDILDLQHRLPASILRLPYEILNRMNRNKLERADDELVATISHENYFLSDDADHSLDLFAVLGKQ